MIISESMRYLMENGAHRLNSLDQLKEGGIYAIGRGREFGAFLVPQEEKVERSKGMLIIPEADEYRAHIRNGEITEENMYRDISVRICVSLDIPHMGVFKPRKGTALRKILEEKLKAELPELVA